MMRLETSGQKSAADEGGVADRQVSRGKTIVGSGGRRSVSKPSLFKLRGMLLMLEVENTMDQQPRVSYRAWRVARWDGWAASMDGAGSTNGMASRVQDALMRFLRWAG